MFNPFSVVAMKIKFCDTIRLANIKVTADKILSTTKLKMK